MGRSVVAASISLYAGAAILMMASNASAQTWNDSRTMSLVSAATARRASQLADTGLVDYRAIARGYLTFLAQLGEGFPDPPRLVKADELALEVYWRAPDLSKQRILGRRDTLLLPTDIEYHRDHLGIVQNNFPDIIRLGEGDEVSDVPHPLSPEGMFQYDFSIRDSVELRLPTHTISLYEVRVRPRNERAPRVIGAVYLERESAQVVRMAFNFTRAAFLDRNLEDISIVLENGLVGARFWLPVHQEVEIRRTGAWMDYPARGIIRGRWEICCYELNVGTGPQLFAGPEIVLAPPQLRAQHRWEGSILDSLPPDIRVPRPEDIRRVQEEARALVRREALSRAGSPRLAASGVSDLVRFNRVEGLAVGLGTRFALGGGLVTSGKVRYGISDQQLKGRASLAWESGGFSVGLFGEDDHRQAGDVQERSGVINSIAAQEFGSDHTDPFRVRAAGVTMSAVPIAGGLTFSASAAFERHDSVTTAATPARGAFRPTISAIPLDGWRVTLAVRRATALAPLGFELSGSADAALLWYRETEADPAAEREVAARFFASLELERPVGGSRIALRTLAGAVRGSADAVPAQELVLLGGNISAPGYEYHSLAGTTAFSQRVEWRASVPFARVPLGRYGTAPGTATLAPFAAVAVVSAQGETRTFPSLGAGLLVLFDMIRFDVARGLNDGRWTFGVDVGRELWRIL